ncbi:NHL repeat-containing protein [Tengunoibacter tsumagoiensis]|uniref:WxL domain-containing protein n=1 Tax=Tengunoibacter tsumagoiensis TaxID=2014871 RepID=A0A402A665_9CHLR|nr:NHL repeat-containing protein [Tengunoibacter tsumagoiensis]GCE14481.1 hypothetical protein KTT_43400 [Tengunoibacter tsumagoiensis]
MKSRAPHLWIKGIIFRLIFLFIFTSTVLVLQPVHTTHAITLNPVAVTVYGQGGSFTASTANNGGITASSLNSPRRVVNDSNGNLYISDFSNNRVLYYIAGSTTATRVYGQNGSFTTNIANNGGVSANSLSGPKGMILDSNGGLYIVDSANNRVLYYTAGSTTATRVYGQNGSFITNLANNGLISANSLNSPVGVAVDSSNNLYIADGSNNRVLFYPSGSTTATRVYGQNGSFITNLANNGGISANSLSLPVSVGVDGSGNVYISDVSNNRMLYYPSTSTTATRVFGQGGNFTTGTANNGGITASSLSQPYEVHIDSSYDVYLVDIGNNRVLFYPPNSTIATRVFGQGGSFTTGTANNGGISAASLNQPIGSAFYQDGTLYVADSNNNRVLKFQTGLAVYTQPPASSLVNASFSAAFSLIDIGSGGIYTDFTGPVTLAIKSGTGATGATLSGPTAVNAVNGVATFSNLSIDKGSTGYILSATNPSVGTANTNAFTIIGPLLFTPLSNPTFSFTLTGATSTIVAQHIFKVNDTTQSGVGWHVTITSTQFTTTDGKTLPTTATKITGVSAACTSGQTCTVPTNSITYPITVPAASTAPVASTYYNAAGGTGTGDITITTTFSLTVPQGTASGTYTSTFTETLIKGQ